MAVGAKKQVECDEAALCDMMRGYLEGRIEAFDALHAALAWRLRAYLLSLCRDRALADDLVQEAFVQMHRSRRTYEPGRPVTPWAFAIARHVFLMDRRRAGRRRRFEEQLAADAMHAEAVTDGLTAFLARDGVRRALRDVPADQREVVILHHVHGWSFSEIASRLGIRAGAARVRAFRGMRKLRERLDR